MANNNNPRMVATLKEWRNIPEKERKRMVDVTVNKINRRMSRLEKAGFADIRGYEMMAQLAEIEGGKYATKSAKPRITKATAGMSDKEMYRYYKRMTETITARSGIDGGTTQTVRGARKAIKEMGTTWDGKTLFTPQEYADLTPEEKSRFWKIFHKYRDYLEKNGLYRPGRVKAKERGAAEPSVYGGESFMAFRTEMLNEGKNMETIGRSHFSKNRARRILELSEEIYYANKPKFDNDPLPEWDYED